VLNLDIVGRPAGDTLAVAGLHEVEWPTPLAGTGRRPHWTDESRQRLLGGVT
jgi:hypothetical protein